MTQTPPTPPTSQVGVIVPAYNYGHYLDECLGSLAQQTFTDFTALIIDNASSDNTQAVAEGWVARDPRFRYVRNDTNIGLSGSLLKAYDLLDNPLMMMLSADDTLGPRFLELTVGALDRHPRCVLAYTRWEGVVDRPGQPGHGDRPQPFIPHERSGVFDEIEVLLAHNWITNSICLWRRAVCEVTGRFDSEGLRYVGDWHLYMRLLSEGPAYFINEVHGYYRLHGAAESDRLTSERRAGPDHVRFYDLIASTERWPMTVRCLARAHQMRWMTGEPLMQIVDRLGGPHAHPIIREMMENVRHDVIVGAARAVLEYTPEPNALDTPANALAAVRQVLAEAPAHPGALALLARHDDRGRRRPQPAHADAAPMRRQLRQAADRLAPAATITVLVDARSGGPLRRTLRSLKWQSLAPAHIVLIDAPAELADAGCIHLGAAGLTGWLAAQARTPGWLLGLQAGDTLDDDALYHCARAIETAPEARIVYTDHDEIGLDDCVGHPDFKPDANPELLRSTPYLGRALLVRNDQLDGHAAPLELVASHGLALEVLAATGAAALHHVPALLMHLDARVAPTVPSTPEQGSALAALVHAHAGRVRPGTTVIDGPGAGQFAWLPPLASTPLVSIIIPTKDQLELLTRCLDTLLGETRYPAFEVIVVDNDSQTEAARDYLARLEAGENPRVRVLRHPGAFNFSAMNNRAAATANGDYLLLLNNDTEVVEPFWLTTLMRHAMQDEVGVVGPLLLFPDGRIQHAGVVLGLRGPAEHPFMGMDPDDPGYQGRIHLQQDYSAVTGACLLTRTSLYLRLGGLDEQSFAVSYNDIDYCLRVREAGYRVVWTPLARMMHVSSASQLGDIEDSARPRKTERFLGEQLAMYRKWPAQIASDPAYNPNLSVRGESFVPETEPLLCFDAHAHPGAPRLLALLTTPIDAGRHRILEPLAALRAAQVLDGGLLPAPLAPHLVLHSRADRLWLQLPASINQLDALHALTQLPGITTVFDGDDLLRAIPYLDNRHADFLDHLGEQLETVLREMDTVLASNPRLAAALARLNDNVQLVPERLHEAVWAEPPAPLDAVADGQRLRVAWWQTDGIDVALIVALVEHFRDAVDFLCIGPCPPQLVGQVRQLTPGDALELPAWLAHPSWDIAIAPLVDGAQAALGSDLLLHRLGWCGRPVLCSDAPAYDNALPVTRLSRDLEAWITALGTLMRDPEQRIGAGTALQQAVLAALGATADGADAWSRALAGTPLETPSTPPAETCRAHLADLLRPLRTAPATEAPAPTAPRSSPAMSAPAPAADTRADDEAKEARAVQRAQITAIATPDAASHLLDDDYATFLEQRTPMPEDMQFIEASAARWAHAPTIQVLVDARASEFELLSTTLDSLGAQPYGLWSLSIVSTSPCPDPTIAELPNIDWVHDDAATAHAKTHFDTLVAARGADIVVYVPPGTAFDPLCLWRVAHEFAHHPDWMALYTDDDVMRMDGKRVEPRFKPDFNLDLLRGTDYIGPLWTRVEAWQRAGGFSAQAGTRFYDLTLRVLDTVGAEAIGHIADTLLSLPVSPTLLIADKEAAEAVSAHLTRCGQAHRIRPGNLHGSWHVTYEHDTRPAVDIVVPYRNWLEFTEPLVDSLFRLTEWPQFRLILVDAGSDDLDCAAWRDRLIDAHGEQIRYVRSDAAWNWSELFNLGAAHSDAPYLLFLHHDTQILSGHWLERLMAHAMRPEVAAVAPRQAIPGDNSLDMSGTVFGLAPGLASPEAAGTAMDYPGYLGRLQLTQNFSLLASACLLVPRTRFDATGGFDPAFGRRDAVADLSARLARDGLLVWTPTVTVAHYETDLPPIEAADELACVETSAQTQTALIRERIGFVRRYQEGLARDPAWNLNLRLKADDIQPETTFVPPWHAVPADIPRVVADVVRGAGEYRAAAPLRAARRAGKAMGAIIQPPALNARRMLNAIELARLDGVSSFLIHNPALKEQIPVLQQMHTHLPDLPVIGLMDDLSTAVPHQSDLFDQWSRETRTYMRRCLALCDRLVVSTEPLAEFARHMIDDIRIVPNRLEWARWGHVQSHRRAGRRPRVGWAGAFQHAGDLALVEEAIRLTSQEVDWIFFGMCPASLAPYVREHHTWVDFDHYPEGLASLNLDLAIAPLEENIFNDAKSNLRLLDYGILGWPVVCSDVTPYRGAPVTRVANTTEAWVKAIREHVHDLDAAEQAGDRLREWVLADYILEEHVDDWLAHHLP